MVEFICNLFTHNWFCFIAGIIVGINLYIIILRNKWVKIYMYQRNYSDLMYKINHFYFSAVLLASWVANAVNILRENNLANENDPTDQVEILKKALNEIQEEFDKQNYKPDDKNNNDPFPPLKF